MRTWTVISKSIAKKLVNGINSATIVQSRTREEIETWRDIKLAKLLKVLREDS